MANQVNRQDLYKQEQIHSINVSPPKWGTTKHLTYLSRLLASDESAAILPDLVVKVKVISPY